MPRRSTAQHQHSHCSSHASPGRPADASVRRWAAGYTLAHAGRQLRLGPMAFWVVVGTLVIMAAWSITTATYFAFSEDVLTRLLARQAELQFGYEDRIAELRTRIDRIAGRQLIDQEQYEQKLEGDFAPSGRFGSARERHERCRRGHRLGQTACAFRRAAGDPLKPSLLNDKGAFLVPLDRGAPADPRTSVLAKGVGGVGGAIARLQASLDRVEQRQNATVNSLAETYDSKARRIRGVLAELGLDLGKVVVADAGGAIGGPFIPAPMAKDGLGFERQLHRIRTARAQIVRLTRTIGSVPVRKRVDGDIERAPDSASAWTRSRVRRRCIPDSICTARPAIPSAPPPTAR